LERRLWGDEDLDYGLLKIFVRPWACGLRRRRRKRRMRA
jgi:hypothetical protein